MFISADQWLVFPTEGWLSFGTIMAVSVLLVVSMLSTLYILFYWLPRLREKIRTEASAENQAVGMNKANEAGGVTVPDVTEVMEKLQGALDLLVPNSSTDPKNHAGKNIPNKVSKKPTKH